MKRQAVRKHWQRHITRHSRSGLGKAAYCEAHDLSLHQFHYWARKLPAGPAARSLLSDMVRVDLSAPPRQAGRMGIKLGPNTQLAFDSLPCPRWVAKLARAYEEARNV